MKYRIEGTIAQHAELTFEHAGEAAWAANGSLMAGTDGISWDLRVPGGLGGALKRSMAGEGISLTWIENTVESPEHVQLTANQPGRIMEWDLDRDGALVATRGAFLAAFGEEIDINVSIARRAGAALFGGAGLFLQKVGGSGTVLVHGSGDFSEARLGPGQSITVSTGNLAAFSDSVDYSIRGVGGLRKALFSGEGFFMARLTGPGRVLLQTLKRMPAVSAKG